MILRGKSIVAAVLFLTIGAVAAQQLPELKKIYPGPDQPIPFSHKTHAAQKLECRACHPMPEPGDFMEIAETKVCMACHESIKTDSPAIQKLTEFHKKDGWVEWEPVYLLKDYVFFSHKQHLADAGAQCADCHGPVEQRDVMAKERDISMAGCMDCHRSKGASLKCDACHEPR